MVIVNRSMVVGKSLAMLMLNKNATVTICHSRTKNIEAILQNADIIVETRNLTDVLDIILNLNSENTEENEISTDYEGRCGYGMHPSGKRQDF